MNGTPILWRALLKLVANVRAGDIRPFGLSPRELVKIIKKEYNITVNIPEGREEGNELAYPVTFEDEHAYTMFILKYA